MSRESDLDKLREQARTAYLRGRPTFVARLKLGVWGIAGQGEVAPWMDSLDAVESVGWVLDRWSTCADAGGGALAFPLFRRREVWAPQDHL